MISQMSQSKDNNVEVAAALIRINLSEKYNLKEFQVQILVNILSFYS